MKLRRRQKRKQDTGAGRHRVRGQRLGGMAARQADGEERREGQGAAAAVEGQVPPLAQVGQDRTARAAVAGGVAAAVRRKLKRDEPEVLHRPAAVGGRRRGRPVARHAAAAHRRSRPGDPGARHGDRRRRVGAALQPRRRRRWHVGREAVDRPARARGRRWRRAAGREAEPPDAAAEPPDASEADELATFTRSATMDGQDGATDDDEPAKAEADDDDSGPAKAEAEGDDDSEPAETEAEK